MDRINRPHRLDLRSMSLKGQGRAGAAASFEFCAYPSTLFPLPRDRGDLGGTVFGTYVAGRGSCLPRVPSALGLSPLWWTVMLLSTAISEGLAASDPKIVLGCGYELLGCLGLQIWA